MTKLPLDKGWEIALDEQNRGLAEHWPARGFPSSLCWQPIGVPGIWQEAFPDYEGVAWYRRRFTVPAAWKSQRIALNVGAANFAASTWLNGKAVGSHVGGYTPFTFDVTDAARLGQENELIIRVADPGVDKEIDGYRLNQIPCAKEIWYHNFSGIYQPVYLEATSHVYVRDVFAYLREDNLVVRFEVENTAHQTVLSLWHVTLRDGDIIVADANGALLECKPGVHTVRQTLNVRNAIRWSPRDPHVHRLTVALSGGMGGTDSIETRIGLRTVSVRRGCFILNGEQWRPKMLLYQPHYPAVLAYPSSDELVRQEMAHIKAAGFDMVRFHLKPPPPLYLDLCDEMGLTVYAETALGWIRHSDAIKEHFRREITETMRRDRNHPSIVVWGIINENAREVATARAMLPLARRLDPSRPAIDNCGAFAMWDSGGWLSQSHIAEAGRPRDWPDLHIYVRTPVSQEAYDWLNTVGRAGGQPDPVPLGYGDGQSTRQWQERMGTKPSPIFVSEYGVGALPDLDAVVAAYRSDQMHLPDARDQISLRDSLTRLMQEHRITETYLTIAVLAEAEGQNMAEGIRWQTEALRSNPQVTGYGLLQYNDASWEIGAGLVDQWRRPKPAYAAARQTNTPLLLAISGHLRNVRCGDEVTMRCVLVNDDHLTGQANLHWQVNEPHEPGGQVVLHSVKLTGERIQPLPTLSMTPCQEGKYILSASLWRAGQTLCMAQAYLFAWDEAAHPVLAHPITPVRQNDTVSAAIAAERDLWIVQPGKTTEEQLAAVLRHVSVGDAGLFLDIQDGDADRLNRSGLLPFTLSLRCAPSSWLGYLHHAHAHPVFAGLPAPGLLGRQEYNEVLPRRSLVGLPGECVVVALSSTGIERARMAKVLPEFWAGSDLQVVPYGRGMLIFSQFLLSETVGREPVADRLLRNLVRFGLSGGKGFPYGY